jgi:hypothetical protein
MLMIFYKNRKWNMCSEKVRYVQHGEEITQYVGSEGHDWWIDFEQKHSHTEIIEFVDVEATQEQLNRLNEVNQLNIGDGFSEMLGNYVKDGIFPNSVNHPLKTLQTTKENQEQGIDLSEREIQEIIQGQEISDLDIRILMLEMGGN